jgi:hypothetical protein
MTATRNPATRNRTLTLAVEPDGPVIVVDHDEIDALARALADRTAGLIREHLHVDQAESAWCPLCQAEAEAAVR